MSKLSRYSTTNLHKFQSNIHIGFLSEDTLQLSPNQIEVSFMGGKPIWLQQPKQQQLQCSKCKISFTFLGQLYCPFNDDRCYHRILYILFCGQCLREFKCIRQQSTKQWKAAQFKYELKQLQNAYQVISDPLDRNDFIKMLSKLKLEVEDGLAIEQYECEDESETLANDDDTNSEALKQFQKYDESEVSNKQQNETTKFEGQQQQQTDVLFEVYKKAISELGNPCMMYTDIALLYNSRMPNPQHFCPKCGSKVSLEMQITEKVLSIEGNSDSRLLLMDWGSLFVYTCVASCDESTEECVIVQYETDAIGDEQVKKLTQLSKKKKKKEKQNSKAKGKQNSHEKGEQPQKQINKQQEKEQQNGYKHEQENEEKEGDWD